MAPNHPDVNMDLTRGRVLVKGNALPMSSFPSQVCEDMSTFYVEDDVI